MHFLLERLTRVRNVSSGPVRAEKVWLKMINTSNCLSFFENCVPEHFIGVALLCPIHKDHSAWRQNPRKVLFWLRWKSFMSFLDELEETVPGIFRIEILSFCNQEHLSSLVRIVVPQEFREACFPGGWSPTHMDYFHTIQNGCEIRHCTLSRTYKWIICFWVVCVSITLK